MPQEAKLITLDLALVGPDHRIAGPGIPSDDFQDMIFCVPHNSPFQGTQIMPLTISDDLLDAAGLSPEAARVEIACRMFESGNLALWPAAQWAGLSRVDFENELSRRNIPLYRPTWEQIEGEVRGMEQLGI